MVNCMKIMKLELKNEYMSSNCYLLIKDDEAVVIDPGFDDLSLFNYLKDNNLKVSKVILTHGHYDHWTGLEKLLSIYENAKVYASSLDNYWFNNNPFTKYKPKINYDLNNFESLNLFNKEIKIIKTPGHSKGSISLYFDNNLISGDLIFFEGIGRYDLDGGDFITLKDSIKKIYKLDDNTTIYSGHGRNTKIGYEKLNNPFVNKNS